MTKAVAPSDLVSIITPAYNAEKFIAETIRSVLSQTHEQWEMLIIDDGSVDNTIEIVKQFCAKDARIKLIEPGKNSGPAVARNIGLANAQGRYIAFLDSDDLYLPRKLELQIKFMRGKNAAISFTAYRQMSETGLSVGALIEPRATVDYKRELRDSSVACGTVMIDKWCTGEFEFPLIASSEDYLLWLNLLKRGHVAYGLSADLMRYRKPQGSKSSNKLIQARGVWEIYRQHEGLNLWQAMFNFTSCVIISVLRNFNGKPGKDDLVKGAKNYG